MILGKKKPADARQDAAAKAAPKKGTAKTEGAEGKKAPRPRDYNIVIRPILSEKSTAVSQHNQVVFQVAHEASKPEIRAAVEALFKVKVVGVNVQIRKGKTKMFQGRKGFRPDVKIAYVRLAEGQSIDVATGI
jgi:large subunit ribosomal protein L23